MLCNRQHSEVSTEWALDSIAPCILKSNCLIKTFFLSSLMDPTINFDEFFPQIFSNESLFLLSQINLIGWKVG